MKNKLIALVSVFLPVLFDSFANQVPQHVYPAAILPFAVKGEFDALYAEAAQDKFTTEVMKSNQYVVIGQPQLDKAIREANFTAGNSDEAAAIKGGERTSENSVGFKSIVKWFCVDMVMQNNNLFTFA